MPVLRGQDGCVYTGNSANSDAGFKINKYSPTGTLIGTVSLSTVDTLYSPQLEFLPNGNIVAVWAAAGQKLNHAIVDPDLKVVKAAATIGNGPYGLIFGFAILAGGGYAVCYDDCVTNTQQKFATFDNTGNAVVAPMTVFNKGTAGGCYTLMRQLSNGNLVIGISHPAANPGQAYAVITPAGAIVKALTTQEAYAQQGWIELDVMGDYFCFAMRNAGTGLTVITCNNAGVVQNTTQLNASAGFSGYVKVLNDGAKFIVLYHNASALKRTDVPATGGTIATVTFASSNAIYNLSFDAFLDDDLLVVVSQSSAASANQYSVWRSDGTSVRAPTTFGTGAGTTGGHCLGAIKGELFSFIAAWNNVNAGEQRMQSVKWADSAIIGVTAAAAAKGSLVSIAPNAGAYTITTIKLNASPFAFDHTATNIPGNKGSMMSNGVILKGI